MRVGIPLVVICAALLLWGCRSEPVTWRTPLHRVVFLNDTLTWGDVVPDTLWTEGQTGLVLNASGSSALLNADALLPNLDTSWSSEFVLPFIGGPIPIAPGAEIWSEVEAVNLSVPDVDLRRIRIGSGALILTASSTVQGPLELKYRIEGAVFPEGTNGGSNEVVLQILPGQSTQFVLPLSEVELDLDGGNNLEWSRLYTSWSVGVPADVTEDVGLFGSDMLTLDVGFEGLQVAQVEGRFGSRTLEVEESVSLDGADALQDVEVAWTALELELEFLNTTGMDLGMTIGEVSRTDGGEVPVVTPLIDPALASPIVLPRATVSETGGMADWTIASSTAGYVFGTGDGNLPEFLSSVPDVFVLQAAAEINPFGDVSGGYDRIDLSRLPEVEWTLTAPLHVGASRAVWLDTLNPQLPEGIEFDGDLILSFSNSLPVGASIGLSLVDVPEHLKLLAAGIGATDWFSYPVVEVSSGNGVSAEPVVSEVVLSLLPIQFSALRQGAQLQIHVTLETPLEGASFDVTQNLVVQGNLDGDAILFVE